MFHTRRPARRLVPLGATGALVLWVALAPAASATAAAALVAEPGTTSIADVQGTGASTPLNGTVVTVDGVVTADLTTGGYRGVYIQTPGSGGATDATPGASDGNFVFLGSSPSVTPAIGDAVRVTGTAGEYFGLTQISASSASSTVEITGRE